MKSRMRENRKSGSVRGDGIPSRIEFQIRERSVELSTRRMSVYSREDRIEAVELWLKCGKSTATVIRELGYPSRTIMRIWYKDYLQEQDTQSLNDRGFE